MPSETSTAELTAPSSKFDEIVVQGTWNVRDVGGQAGPIGSSEPLRMGVLLRAASLSAVDSAGVAQLSALGVTKVLDLRGDVEVARDGADVVPVGTTVLHLPFGIRDRSSDGTGGADVAGLLAQLTSGGDPTKIATAVMGNVYQGFVTDPAAHVAVAAALRTIAENEGATLVHCSAGKDRTGWIVALVQTICEVSEEDVLAEYLRSATAASRLAQSMPIVPGVDPAVWDEVLTVRPEYLAAAWGVVREAYGSVDNYLDAIGFDAWARTALRVRFGLTA